MYKFKFNFYDHAPEDVLPACELTLKNLQLDHLDLYLDLSSMISDGLDLSGPEEDLELLQNPRFPPNLYETLCISLNSASMIMLLKMFFQLVS